MGFQSQKTLLGIKKAKARISLSDENVWDLGRKWEKFIMGLNFCFILVKRFLWCGNFFSGSSLVVVSFPTDVC